MVWFMLIGEGRPAKALLDVIVTTPGATIDAFVIEQPERNPLADLARQRGVRIVDRLDLASECARLAAKPGGWLLNANSTFIIPPDVLDIFEGRSLNFHPGLLPEYAGLHTHQWAIRNGEDEFGVTVHRMERRIDTGNIVAEVRFPIKPDDTGLSLFGRCIAAGTEIFSRIVAQIIRGEQLFEVPQDLTRRRVYRHRDALDGRIDWDESATKILRFIRAGNYEPFRSPTYVAHLDRLSGFDVSVLGATVEGSSTAGPGTVLEVPAAGPLIACGGGSTIRIVKARSERQLMSREAWHEYVSRLPGNQLLGRGRTRR
jgi:methionyl-tRNA formyltransferase